MDEREACFQCGEPALREARVCPHCRHGLLVDVRLQRAPADGRVRYQLARSLASGAPGVLPFVELQRALGTPGGVLARGVTRSVAARLNDAAQAFDAELSWSASTPSRSRRLPVAAAAVALAGVGVALAVVGLRSRPGSVTPSAPASARPAAATTPEPALSPREIVARVMPSVAALRCDESLGAGFFVGAEDLLTNAHVLCRDGATLTVRLRDGRSLPGAAVRRDDALDLALVHVPGANAAALPLGDAGSLVVGDRVLAAGSPVGLEFSVSEGLVSNLDQALFGVAYVQTDAKINPGNSGGPLLDARGRVVGIVSLKHAQAEGIAFALPINYAWSGLQPFVAPPEAAAPDSEGWQAMLARAEEQNREVRGEIAALDLRPGLIGVRVDQYQRLVARVLQPARTDPGYTDVKFKLWSGDAVVCSLGGSISEWKLVERGRGGDAERRVWAWLESNGLDARLFVGEAAMSWNFCPHDRLRSQGAVLELEDANPEAAKLELVYR